MLIWMLKCLQFYSSEVLVSADVDPALLKGLCQNVQVQGEILPRLALLAAGARFLLRLKPLRHPSGGR